MTSRDNGTGTASQYTANGLTVRIDWGVSGTNARLVATISTDDEPNSIGTLTAEETRHIVRTAKDHTEYARIYHDMIS